MKLPTVKPDPAAYDGLSRWILIVAGIALTVVGFALWFFPVKHSKPAPASAKCTNAKNCFVKVDDAPTLLLSSIVVLGVLVALVGLNNRRITKLSGPGGIGFETASDQAAETAKAKAAAELTAGGASHPSSALVQTLAATNARALALTRERALGRMLTPDETEMIADSAVRESVQAVAAAE